MAGPGIRCWELARALAFHANVVLAVPGTEAVPLPPGVSLCTYDPASWHTLAPVVSQASVLVCAGDTLDGFPQLSDAEPVLVVDGYDPHTIETLALFAGSPEQENRHRKREEILRRQCLAGDFFICASERQRDWWLGLLEASGRINVHTYQEDPSLRRLVDVVPFGLASRPMEHTRQVLKGVWPGIGEQDRVILWGGGLWEWLDPLTAVRAVALLRPQRDDLRLVFPGTRHPNPVVPEMRMVARARSLAEQLGLLDHSVFFGEWVPYEDWPNYLAEADVALSLHIDSLESRLAFRSRVLDYIWAGLPMVLTAGDATAELADRFGLGRLVAGADAQAVAEGILALLGVPRDEFAAGFASARKALSWERAAAPLVEFCRHPRRAPDKLASYGPFAPAAAIDAPKQASVQPGGITGLLRRIGATASRGQR